MKNTAVVFLLALVMGATAGWFVNGWRLSAKFHKANTAAVEEFKRITERQRQLWEEQSRADQQRRNRLSQQLSESTETVSRLRNDLAGAKLLAVAPSIEALGECPSHEEIQAVVRDHNPIGPDFVRLWNASAGGIDARADSP